MAYLFDGEESNEEIIFLHKSMDRLIEKIRKDFSSSSQDLRGEVLYWCPIFNYIAKRVGISSMLQRDNNDSENLSEEDLNQLCDRFIRKVATSYGCSENELYIMVLRYSQVIDSLKSKLGLSKEDKKKIRQKVKERRIEHIREIMDKRK